MINEPYSTRRDPVISERVRLRTMAERRRRVWRSLALFMVTVAAMVVIVMLRRDTQAVESCRHMLDDAVGVLHAELAKGHGLPPTFPQSAAGRSVLRTHFHYSMLNAQFLAGKRQIGICSCEQPHRLFLQRNGRHVALFDGENFEVRWVDEEEFRRNAAAWGFVAP